MPVSKVPIIFFHNINLVPRKAKIKGCFTTPHKFKKQMEFLYKNNFQTVLLEDIVGWIQGKNELPEKPVAITFDDGYRDNYLYAFPVLKEYRYKATFFIVPALIGRNNEWAIQKGEMQKPLMSLDEIRTMKDHGFRFGSHTLTHRVLTGIDPEQARHEVIRSKEKMESLLETACHFIAYPAGFHNEAVQNMVKLAGYKGALTTQPGFVENQSNPYLMNRFEVLRRQSSKLKFLTG